MQPGIEQCEIKDFQAHLKQYLQHIRQSAVPLFVTESNEAAVVMMSVASFVALQQLAGSSADRVRRLTSKDLTTELSQSAAPKGQQRLTKTARSHQRQGDNVYQLKITLKHIRPPIWRRVLVPGEFSLGQLHQVIQVVMAGWCDGHLHEFEIDGEHYSQPPAPGEDWGVPIGDEATVKLADVLGAEKSKCLYIYDFGDDWQHEVLVEKILPIDPNQTYPVCLKGKRACPPEDCGGPWGYAELLAILADPKHPEYDERCEWLIGDFDPECFDPDSINEELATI
jgi:hypothetical protein